MALPQVPTFVIVPVAPVGAKAVRSVADATVMRHAGWRIFDQSLADLAKEATRESGDVSVLAVTLALMKGKRVFTPSLRGFVEYIL